MNIKDVLGKRIIYFDGGTGTLLQDNGLKAGELPELWNITKPEILIEIHRKYFEAGSDIVPANTFGANSIKFDGYDYSVEEIIKAGIDNVKTALKLSGRQGFIALDVGPTGKLLQPMGDLSFDQAYNSYKQAVIAGEKYGADIITIETMSDTYELKAAVLAAKENTSLPVFATVVFDENGKTLTGGDVSSVVALLEGLGVDAFGINCGLGPTQMKPIIADLLKVSSVPIIVNPNAGLPRVENGKTIYDINAQQFAEIMSEFVDMGVWLVGGCCGTNYEHIKQLRNLTCNKTPKPIQNKDITVVSSYSKSVHFNDKPIIIGERINPTGKARFKDALRNNDVEYILHEAFTQIENGADILDVNVGLPDIDEAKMIKNVITQLQSVTDTPLQIDTIDIVAMEDALRYYNGKAMVNSVNGKEKSMKEVFPLIKKYGGVVVGLTIDENGIPETPQQRLAVAEKIIDTAKSYGIDKKDIIIDVLCLTVSSEPKGAVTALESIKLVKEKLGVKTILGISNISFGLPQREIINQNFYTMALQNGLDCAILNPNSKKMMEAYHAFSVLNNFDINCLKYIEKYSGIAEKNPVLDTKYSLNDAIKKGLKELSYNLTKQLLNDHPPLFIINDMLIPALDVVGAGFENGTLFLPQLLMSAESAKVSFDAIKDFMAKTGETQQKKEKIILATVKGDIHDIGKNIVKVLLENYGYDMIDLGKDVAPETILKATIDNNVKLVGLSALMTTTVPSMEDTIKLLRKNNVDCKVMVGGAVLNQEYSDMIGADSYQKDAMGSVHYAQKIFGHN